MRFRFVLTILAVSLFGSPTTAVEGHDCYGQDNKRRIEGCSRLIEQPGLAIDQLAEAYAMRALAYSLLGRYESAINDYNEAINLIPDYAIALNNRAWAYFKWGRPTTGLPDVQRSLQLDATSAHAFDTRAHIYQWLGQKEQAIQDYDAAMRFGGSRMIRLYQCGLQAQRFYSGPTDGIMSPELTKAIRACVNEQSKCDPLPPDEECKIPTS
ncbi:MAG: hypothetical protein RLZ98_1740 [Pseudomonadota bacterium]